MHSSHAELKAVLRKWDSVGALLLLDVDALLASGELLIEELCGMFPIYKDHLYDRLILNPTVRNGRTDSVHCFVRTLGQGFMFCRMHLPPDMRAIFSSSDLSELYSTIRVSDK